MDCSIDVIPIKPVIEPKWCCNEKGEMVLEEHHLYNQFLNDGRFNMFRQMNQHTYEINAVNAALWASEKQINETEFGINYKEAILYYAAHILYLSFVLVETDTVDKFKTATSDAKNVLSNGVIFDGIRENETWIAAGYKDSRFGQHLRTLLQTSIVGFVTI